MNKKEKELFESIRKLISLGVGDEEIVLNLKDVGVSEADARILLSQAKGEPKPSEKELAAKLAAELKPLKPVKPKEPPKLAEAKKILEKGKKPREKKEEAKKESKVPERVEGEDLWEKGIISTINEKIDEIESIKEDIDSVIESRVKKGLEKEVKRIRLLLDSEHARMREKLRASLGKKAEEMTARVEERIAELEKLKTLLNQKIRKQETGREEIKAFVSSANSLLTELKNLKGNLASKIPEVDKKISSSLEMQAKVVDGLVKDTATKIDSRFKTREKSFQEGLNKKVGSLVQVSKQLDAKAIEARLAKIESLASAAALKGVEEEKKAIKESLAGMQAEFLSLKEKMQRKLSEARFEKEFAKLKALREEVRNEGNRVTLELENFKDEFKKIIAAQISDRVVDVQKDFDAVIQDKKVELKRIAAEAARKARPEKFDQKMEELALFKEQFLKTIERNVNDLKKSKEKLTSKINERVGSLNTKINLIDMKIKELDAFEKNFAKTMGLALENLVEKKTKKGKPKGKVKSKKTVPGKSSPLTDMIKEIKKKPKQ